MRVFVDTNVLVSAFTARGLCSELVSRLNAGHQLIVSTYVEDETRRVLREKFRAGDAQVAAALSLLAAWERAKAPDQPASLRDAQDEPILAAAVAAKADLLVTGDRDLTDLPQSSRPLPIMTPRQVLELLNRIERR